MYFRVFVIISLWKRLVPFIWTNLNPLYSKIHCAKLGWNWLTSSGEENLLISSMYFRYFVIISPWKGSGPFIWVPSSKGFFVPSLVEIGLLVLEKKIFVNFLNVFLLFLNYLSLEKGWGLHLNKLESPSPKAMLWGKCGWNWLSGSGEEVFLYFINVFVSIS